MCWSVSEQMSKMAIKIKIRLLGCGQQRWTLTHTDLPFPWLILYFPSTSLPAFVFLSAPKGKLDAIPHNRCLGSQVSSCTLESLCEGSLRSDGVSSYSHRGYRERLRGPDHLSAAWGTMLRRKTETHGLMETKKYLLIRPASQCFAAVV